MKVVDVISPERVNRVPDKTVVLLSSGSFVEQGFIVKRVQLNLYIQKKDERLGPYSLITSHVETDKGEIEMTYDEGYKGEKVLEETVDFLTSHLGISGLILRSVLQLKSALEKNRTQ